MKRRLLIVVPILGLALPIEVLAKGRRPPTPIQTPTEKHNTRLLQLINVNIILTDDQRKAIMAALDNQNRKSADLQRQFESQQKALNDATDQAVNAVLNDEQKVTYARAKDALQNEEAKKARQAERVESALFRPGGREGEAGRSRGEPVRD